MAKRKQEINLVQRPIRRFAPVFILPTFLAFIIGFIWPFLQGIYLSFCNFNTPKDAKWEGLSNYVKVFQDAGFINAFWNTAGFALVSIVLRPVFFASIGLKTELSGMSMGILLFSVAFVLVALLCKVIGCGLMAKILRFKGKDPLRIGVGMMARGEVALIVAQKGLSVNLMPAIYFTSVIIMIICSSVATPIVLKLLYRGEKVSVETGEGK